MDAVTGFWKQQFHLKTKIPNSQGFLQITSLNSWAQQKWSTFWRHDGHWSMLWEEAKFWHVRPFGWTLWEFRRHCHSARHITRDKTIDPHASSMSSQSHCEIELLLASSCSLNRLKVWTQSNRQISPLSGVHRSVNRFGLVSSQGWWSWNTDAALTAQQERLPAVPVPERFSIIFKNLHAL